MDDENKFSGEKNFFFSYFRFSFFKSGTRNMKTYE